MRHLIIERDVRQKDGSMAREREYISVRNTALALALDELGLPLDCVVAEAGRAPEPHERWEDGGWVLDRAALAEEREDARLRGMRPGQRAEDHAREALRRARPVIEARILEILEILGIVPTPAQLLLIRASRGGTERPDTPAP